MSTPLNPGPAATTTGSVAPARPGPLVVFLLARRPRALIAVSLTTALGVVFLGPHSYGLYVYHHFISYYLSANRIELELARWVGSHAAAVALQATLGASVSLAVAYLSYEFFEKRFLLKPLFKTAEDQGPLSSRQRAFSSLRRRTVEQGVALVTTSAVFNDSSGRLNDSSAHRN
jgi:peptidoglycan/LPS O-acetylase OafA/YrhL